MRALDPPEAVARARRGDRRALARLITAVESRSAEAVKIGRLLSDTSGRAHVVGITGAPGVGKSTTTAALIEAWRGQGLTVAVVAVDPSSPFTGGALLGDRIRMSAHSTDPGVYIRSMAARGQLGGLAAATPAAVRVLDGVGFDVVVIETVGVGQSEIDIVRYADTVLILMAPGMGDRVQATKAGLMEVGDVFAVNKSDRTGSRATLREITAIVASKPIPAGGWRPPVLPISATQGQGIADVVAAIADHRRAAEASGDLVARRRERASTEILGLAVDEFLRAVSGRELLVHDLSDRVLSGALDPGGAARELMLEVTHGG